MAATDTAWPRPSLLLQPVMRRWPLSDLFLGHIRIETGSGGNQHHDNANAEGVLVCYQVCTATGDDSP